MFTDDIAMPRAASMTLGMPRPTASAAPQSSIASTSWSTSASGDAFSVGRVCTSPRTPSWRDATATLVPPTSTPITVAMYRSFSDAEREPREPVAEGHRRALCEHAGAHWCDAIGVEPLEGIAAADAHLGRPVPLPSVPLPLVRWVEVTAQGPGAVEVEWNLDDTRGGPGRLALLVSIAGAPTQLPD